MKERHLSDYYFCVRTIESCNTEEQLSAARNVVSLFNLLHKDSKSLTALNDKLSNQKQIIKSRQYETIY